MNFETIRDAIYLKLLGVAGMGKVFRHRRYTNDLGELLNLYMVPHPTQPSKKYACVAWIEHVSAPETGTLDENGTTTYVERTDIWRIELYHSIYDDENEENASVTAFNKLTERIQEAFRFEDDLDLPDIVTGSGPLSLDIADQFTQELGGFTCHYARFTLRTDQHLVPTS